MSSPFNKGEMEKLVRALHGGQSGKYEVADYEAMMAWAEEARLNADLLEMILAGHLNIAIVCQVVTFPPSEQGLSQASRRLQKLKLL